MANDHIRTLSTWRQAPATTRAITDALAEIWRDAARARLAASENPGSDDLQQALIRTSVLNTVVYASSQGVAERADAVMEHLSVTHPSRCIVIVAQPDDSDMSLGAALNARCQTDAEGRPRFCFEQLSLTARGGMVQRLPGIVTQLLIHDLPTLLWWPGEPPIGSPLFTAMARVCDRLIVDSSDFSDPERLLAALAEFAGAQSDCALMSDLNWDRLIDWREMLAQFFDSASLQPYLSQVRTVAIEYSFDPGGQRTSAQGLLLAGWLASRLGWDLERAARKAAGDCVLQMRAAAGAVEITLSASRHPRGQPGALSLVRLTAGEGDEAAVFSIQAGGDGEHGTATVAPSNASPVSRTVRLEPASESVLIGEEMETFGRERAYDDALQAAGSFARRIAGAGR